MKHTLSVWSALLLCASVIAADVDPAAVAAAAKKAEDYLLKQQNDDGTFGKGKGAPVPGYVALVVKALATSPDKLRADNPAMAKAVTYLLGKQQPSGAVSIPGWGVENYDTSCVVIGLTALENPAYKGVLDKAKQYILSCQNDEHNGFKKEEGNPAYGAFNYGSQAAKYDLSNTGFSLEALKALGVPENSPAWKNAVLFIKRCQDNDETNDAALMKGGDNSGGAVYFPGKSEFGTVTAKSGKEMPKPYGSMTYQMVKSLIYAGVAKDDPALQAAYKWIKSNYAVDHNPGGATSQGYFYYVDVFAKAFTAGGTAELALANGNKVNWARDLSVQLLTMQKPDGSFVNPEARFWEGEPVLTTAYALDALNLCLAAMK